MLRAAEVRVLKGSPARKPGDLQKLEKARNEGTQLCLRLGFSSQTLLLGFCPSEL